MTEQRSTPAPTLDPQVIGRVEHAHQALLTALLAGSGLTFHQWVILRLTAAAGGAVDRNALVAGITGDLKITELAALAAVADLTDAELLRADPAEVALTDSGRETFDRLHSAVRQTVARMYGGVPAADLATTAAVLDRITARIDAELDHLAGPTATAAR